MQQEEAARHQKIQGLHEKAQQQQGLMFHTVIKYTESVRLVGVRDHLALMGSLFPLFLVNVPHSTRDVMLCTAACSCISHLCLDSVKLPITARQIMLHLIRDFGIDGGLLSSTERVPLRLSEKTGEWSFVSSEEKKDDDANPATVSSHVVGRFNGAGARANLLNLIALSAHDEGFELLSFKVAAVLSALEVRQGGGSDIRPFLKLMKLQTSNEQIKIQALKILKLEAELDNMMGGNVVKHVDHEGTATATTTTTTTRTHDDDGDLTIFLDGLAVKMASASQKEVISRLRSEAAGLDIQKIVACQCALGSLLNFKASGSLAVLGKILTNPNFNTRSHINQVAGVFEYLASCNLTPNVILRGREALSTPFFEAGDQCRKALATLRSTPVGVTEATGDAWSYLSSKKQTDIDEALHAAVENVHRTLQEQGVVPLGPSTTPYDIHHSFHEHLGLDVVGARALVAVHALMQDSQSHRHLSTSTL